MINGLNNNDYTDITNLHDINSDNINCETFLNQPASYFTGVSSNLQTQINNINTQVTLESDKSIILYYNATTPNRYLDYHDLGATIVIQPNNYGCNIHLPDVTTIPYSYIGKSYKFMYSNYNSDANMFNQLLIYQGDGRQSFSSQGTGGSGATYFNLKSNSKITLVSNDPSTYNICWYLVNTNDLVNTSNTFSQPQTFSDITVNNQINLNGNTVLYNPLNGTYNSIFNVFQAIGDSYTKTDSDSLYQTISGMSNYASINGLSKLGGSINVMGGSYSLNFGDNRYLIIDGYPIITSIGLPSPTSSNNLGCVFSIVNKAGIPPNRSVSAPFGQTIYDFNTGTNASSIVIKDIGVIEFICVGISPTNTTTWMVLNSQQNTLKNISYIPAQNQTRITGDTQIDSLYVTTYFNSPLIYRGGYELNELYYQKSDVYTKTESNNLYATQTSLTNFQADVNTNVKPAITQLQNKTTDMSLYDTTNLITIFQNNLQAGNNLGGKYIYENGTLISYIYAKIGDAYTKSEADNKFVKVPTANYNDWNQFWNDLISSLKTNDYSTLRTDVTSLTNDLQDLADDVVGPLITQTINFTSGVPGQDSSIAGRLAISDTLTVNGTNVLDAITNTNTNLVANYALTSSLNNYYEKPYIDTISSQVQNVPTNVLTNVQGNANTFTNTNTFSGDLVQSNKNILQKADITSNTTYNWQFGGPQIIRFTNTIDPIASIIPSITFNLPTVSTQNLGTIIHIYLAPLSYFTLNPPSGSMFFYDENNEVSTSKTYNTIYYNYFCLMAVEEAGYLAQWAIVNSRKISKYIGLTLTDTQTITTGTKTFNCPVVYQQLPSISINNPTFGNTNFITKAYADGVYQLASGMSNYQLVSGMSNYQLISNMSSYYEKPYIDTINNSLTNVNSNLTNNYYTKTYVDTIIKQNGPQNQTFCINSTPANLTTGWGNCSYGYQSLISITSGNRNYAYGYRSLYSCTTGAANFAFGYRALFALTSGVENTIFGIDSGASINTGSFNVGIGSANLANVTSGQGNCVFGRYCGGGLTTTSYNSFFGYFTGVNTTATGNTGYGAFSFFPNTVTGNYNTGVGYGSCLNIVASTNCTCIGYNSGFTSIAGTYSNSTCVGTGSIIDGNNRIILGRSTEVTYPMGGLNIPVSTVLTLLGNISANGSTITPAQLSFLSNVTISNKIPSSTISDINNYQLVSGMSSYLTQSNASSTYLTKTNASTLYQTQLSDNNKLEPNYVNYLKYDITNGNVSFGTPGAGSSSLYNSCFGQDAGIGLNNGINNSYFGWNAGYSTTSGNNNTVCGANSLLIGTGQNNNSVFGFSSAGVLQGNSNVIVGDSCAGLAITNNNCSVFGSGVSLVNGLNHCTAIGSGANGNLSNSIILGRSSDVTYPMGGLTIPVSTVLTLNGNISADSLTVTPTQLSFLSNVTTNQIPSSTISDINNYLTVANASTVYQPQSAMSSYLLSSTASTTYQTQSAMSSYQTKIVNSSLITATTTLSAPYYDYYCILTPNTTTITITLPTPSASLLGTRIVFRRVNTLMAPVNCSPTISSISNGNATVLISAFQYSCEILCLINSATPTYNWFIIRQN
jgi:hypothetical protein